METLSNLQIIGIGGVTVALIGLFLRIWTDTSKRTDHFIDLTTSMMNQMTGALEKQSITNAEVLGCVKGFKRNQDEHYKLLKKLNGEISEILREKNKE